MLANIHVYILTADTIFILLRNLSQILDVAFLLPVSIYASGIALLCNGVACYTALSQNV